MSLNHFSQDFSQTHWWHHHQPQQHDITSSNSSPTNNFWPNNSQFFKTNPISGLRFDLNNEEDSETTRTDDNNHAIKEEEEEEEECIIPIPIPKLALFEKPLTPSDVGKLNRLVIPKQHAEKYFPLNGVSESGEKGLLLSFEDELGKPWRFRYSYWNSSQSYVLTKGWSRFVKEKKLDAGDVVQFQRHRNDCERMFIGWRRRKNVVVGGGENVQTAAAAAVSTGGGAGGWQPYPVPVTHQTSSSHGPPAAAALSLPYPPPASVHAAGGGGGRESRTITAAASSASGNCKRLRLFGVNMECQQQPDYDSVSSNHFPDSDPGPGPGPAPSSTGHYHYYPKLLHAHYDHHPTHMEVDYPRDISQSRYQQEE